MAKRPPTTRVEVKLAEAITVGPDELLVVTIAEDVPQEFIDGLSAHLKECGWEDRVVILVGAEITLGKVEASA